MNEPKSKHNTNKNRQNELLNLKRFCMTMETQPQVSYSIGENISNNASVNEPIYKTYKALSKDSKK